MSLSGNANVTGTVTHRIELSNEVETLAYVALAVWAGIQAIKIIRGAR